MLAYYISLTMCITENVGNEKYKIEQGKGYTDLKRATRLGVTLFAMMYRHYYWLPIMKIIPFSCFSININILFGRKLLRQ